MSNPEIVLTGRVFEAEGQYHCEVAEIGQVTHDPYYNSIYPITMSLVVGYFEACRKIPGKFEREMKRFNVDISVLDPATKFPDIVLTLRYDVPTVDEQVAEFRFQLR